MLCKVCGEKPVIKSNGGIVNELTRIKEHMLPVEDRFHCKYKPNAPDVFSRIANKPPVMVLFAALV